MNILARTWTVARAEAQDTLRVYFAPVRAYRRAISLIALPVLVFMYFFVAQPQVVVLQAETLVGRASVAERARPAGLMQRVRVQLTSSGSQRPVIVSVSELRDGVTVNGANGPASIQTRLAANHFDLERPLSAKDFAAWRSSLSTRRDFVSASNATLVLRTTTADPGDLREVELTVQRESYRVTKMVFTFQDFGRLDIEELAQWVRPEGGPSAPSASSAPIRPLVEGNGAATRRPSQDVPVRLNLRGWAAHTFGDAARGASFVADLRADVAAVRQDLDAWRKQAADTAATEQNARLKRTLTDHLHSLYAKAKVLFEKITRSRALEADALRSTQLETAAARVDALDTLSETLLGQDDITEAQKREGARLTTELLNALYGPPPPSQP